MIPPLTVSSFQQQRFLCNHPVTLLQTAKVRSARQLPGMWVSRCAGEPEVSIPAFVPSLRQFSCFAMLRFGSLNSATVIHGSDSSMSDQATRESNRYTFPFWTVHVRKLLPFTVHSRSFVLCFRQQRSTIRSSCSALVPEENRGEDEAAPVCLPDGERGSDGRTLDLTARREGVVCSS